MGVSENLYLFMFSTTLQCKFLLSVRIILYVSLQGLTSVFDKEKSGVLSWFKKDHT